ncbi:Sialyltransferase-like protein 5, partial [Mucuna pruriens]
MLATNLQMIELFSQTAHPSPGRSYSNDIISRDLFSHSFTTVPSKNTPSLQIENSETIHSSVQQCVGNRELRLIAHIIDHCKLILKCPEGTNNTWYNAQFKKFKPLEYNYDVYGTILLWE